MIQKILMAKAIQDVSSSGKSSSGKSVPTMAQGGIPKISPLKVVVVVVGAYLLYRVAKSIFAGASSQSEVQTAYTELDKLNQNPNTHQKISEFQAKSYANSLFTAMDGYGTDEEAIKHVFYKLKNSADFLAVSKAFGVREVSSGAWNPEPNFKGTMTSALKSELSTDWIKILNKILVAKKITYRL